jgi:hypothetical protein
MHETTTRRRPCPRQVGFGTKQRKEIIIVLPSAPLEEVVVVALFYARQPTATTSKELTLQVYKCGKRHRV